MMFLFISAKYIISYDTHIGFTTVSCLLSPVSWLLPQLLPMQELLLKLLLLLAPAPAVRPPAPAASQQDLRENPVS